MTISSTPPSQPAPTTPAAVGAKSHFAQLDGLRGVAAMVVVVSHSANAGFLPEIFGSGLGKMGVVLFYVLSGFLMGYLYLSKPADRPALQKYAIRRAARILPLFLTVVILSGLLMAIFPVHLYKMDGIQDFVLNVMIIKGTSVLWSIPVEVHFYFLFALMWSLFGRLKRPILTTIIVSVALQVLAVGLIKFGFGYRANTILPYWLHFFTIGALFGYVAATTPEKITTLSQHTAFKYLGWIALLLIPVALPEVRRQAGLPLLPIYMDPLAAGVPLLIFLAAAVNLQGYRWLSHPILRFIGGFSFSLYLLHRPMIDVIAASPTLMSVPGLAFVVLIAVSFATSYLVYRFFERPMQTKIVHGKNPPPATA